MAKYIVTHGIRIAQDFVPETFGRLTTLGPAFKGRCGEQRVTWQVCQCDCGDATVVRLSHLQNGHTSSCGCLRIDGVVGMNTKHGHAGKLTAEYVAYSAMLARCNNPNTKHYADYGGRGIRVFPEWLGDTGFETWLAHIGPKPGKSYSQDRIDGNKGYEPGNVRWATKIEQANNKRNNRLLEYAGRQQTIPQWSREVGIPAENIYRRIYAGWPAEKALTQPTKETK